MGAKYVGVFGLMGYAGLLGDGLICGLVPAAGEEGEYWKIRSLILITVVLFLRE